MFSAQTRVRIKRADNQLSNPIKIGSQLECYQKTCETTLFRLRTLMMHRKFFSYIKTYKMRIIHNFVFTVLNMKEKQLIHLLGREPTILTG